MTRIRLLGFAAAAFTLVGCGNTPTAPTTGGTSPTAKAPTSPAAKDEIAAERAKLPADERKLVEAQEWCAVLSDNRLGEMGKPERIEIKGEPVFLCCEGCVKKAKADPDATLAKVAALKAKKAAAK